VVQIDITRIPYRRTSQPRVWELALRLGAQSDILRCVCCQVCAVDPEAKEGI